MLGPAVARLSAQLAQLTTAHTNNTTSLTSLAQERSQVDDREKEMREMVEKAEAKRAWFGDFKEWTDNVAGFLDEKVCMFHLNGASSLAYLQVYSILYWKNLRRNSFHC